MSEKNESTPTPLSECLRIEAALTTDFGRQERLNTYARMADELEAALAQQAGASEQVLQLLLAGGFVDPEKVEQARGIIASSAPGGGGESSKENDRD